MSVKTEVLTRLEEKKGESISGETLAAGLGVSRAAVWKAIRALQAEGYHIEAVNNKGYCLMPDNDILSEEVLKRLVDAPALYVYKEIDSTNEELKRLSLQNAPSGTLVVANSQTQGKGRRGRVFYSPADTGIYMSILLRPQLDFATSVYITTAASVAVCRAIETVCKIKTQIKWVNDIYYNGHKVCGILTEATTDFESGGIDSIIVGIGINVKTEDFPEELTSVASSLYEEGAGASVRNELTAEVYRELMKVSEDLEAHTFLEEYRRRSMVIGKPIRYSTADGWENATARAIDDAGGLVIETAAGECITLNSGEISIRMEE
jgi:BirA family biotin operon repressor/biotin-[acetyl-CoA-carboxylase] ligase